MSLPGLAQIPCVDNMSGEYPCKNITFLSNLSTDQLLAENTDGVLVNDIWGWVDSETSKEYAIVGMTNGTSFVDVTDPLNPLMLGILPEHGSASSGRVARSNSVWRDIKVFKNHAFIVSEDPNHGMQIFDLLNLRDVDNAPATFPETAHYAGISNAHNLFINEATGYAYALGATRGTVCNGGELHIIDINNPKSPVYAGCFDSKSYTHDAQCIIYDGPDSDYTGQEICFNSNEKKIQIVDVTDKNNPTNIKSFSYTDVQYAHQGWLTEDRKYYISNDELDEYYNDTKTKTFIWDVQDLDNPKLISTYTHGNKAIDHNLYCRDTLVYLSNYTDGFRIMNLKNIETSGLEEVAYFDTYPANNATTFLGSWSNYPYLPSRNIIVSDITNGLFVLRYDPSKNDDNTLVSTIEESLTATRIYPNPAKDYIVIEFSESEFSLGHLELFDLSGQLLIEMVINTKLNKTITVNSSILNNGIYHLRINNGQTSISRKILIDK